MNQVYGFLNLVQDVYITLPDFYSTARSWEHGFFYRFQEIPEGNHYSRHAIERRQALSNKWRLVILILESHLFLCFFSGRISMFEV